MALEDIAVYVIIKVLPWRYWWLDSRINEHAFKMEEVTKDRSLIQHSPHTPKMKDTNTKQSECLKVNPTMRHLVAWSCVTQICESIRAFLLFFTVVLSLTDATSMYINITKLWGMAVHSVATDGVGMQHCAISGSWRGCYHPLLRGFHTLAHRDINTHINSYKYIW